MTPNELGVKVGNRVLVHEGDLLLCDERVENSRRPKYQSEVPPGGNEPSTSHSLADL